MHRLQLDVLENIRWTAALCLFHFILRRSIRNSITFELQCGSRDDHNTALLQSVKRKFELYSSTLTQLDYSVSEHFRKASIPCFNHVCVFVVFVLAWPKWDNWNNLWDNLRLYDLRKIWILWIFSVVFYRSCILQKHKNLSKITNVYLNFSFRLYHFASAIFIWFGCTLATQIQRFQHW